MTYEESFPDTLTKAEVIQALEHHNMQDYDMDDFFDQMGHKEIYSGDAVLTWLGY